MSSSSSKSSSETIRLDPCDETILLNRVATKIFEDVEGALSKEFIMGNELPVTFQTWFGHFTFKIG